MPWKQWTLTACLGLILTASAFAQEGEAQPESQDTQAAAQEVSPELRNQISYAIGANVAQSLQQAELDLDADRFIQAITDVLKGNELQMTPEQMQDAQRQFTEIQMAKQQAETGRQQTENLAEAEKFLAENAGKEGVQTTESGLQFKVIEAGEGESPSADSQVKVHYKGTFLDGEQFDSSYDRGEPATFGVGQVIPGWTEALQLMKPGAKYQLWIHPELGYGSQNRPGIPPNSLLIFEVELLDVVE